MYKQAQTSLEAMQDKTTAPDSLAHQFGLVKVGEITRTRLLNTNLESVPVKSDVLGWAGPNPDGFDQELEMRAAAYEQSGTKDSAVYFALTAAGVEVEK